MIDDLVSGKIAVAYNVLGSYALGREDAQSQIKVILPSNFPTKMMRSGFSYPLTTRLPDVAGTFIKHLTGISGGHF